MSVISLKNSFAVKLILKILVNNVNTDTQFIQNGEKLIAYFLQIQEIARSFAFENMSEIKKYIKSSNNKNNIK